MAELTFCKQFLSALDARPLKLSSDHIADARQYPDGAVFILPKLPSPPHPARPNAPSTSTTSASEPTTLSISLKPMKPSHPTVPLPDVTAATTSVYDLKAAYSTATSIPAAKIKILYKKKPVVDSKTVAEVVGGEAVGEVEFGVMVMGGAVAVETPPAVAPMEKEMETAPAAPAAQGPSGKEVVAGDEFWEDLRGFMVQRIRDEKEGERLVGVFKSAWEKDR